MDDNLSKQVEEIEALCSIYNRDWVTVNEASRSYSICITESNHQVTLFVTLPSEYPLRRPPMYELFAPALDRDVKAFISASLESVYLESVGEAVIFQWIEKIRDILQTLDVDDPNMPVVKCSTVEATAACANKTCSKSPKRDARSLDLAASEKVCSLGPRVSLEAGCFGRQQCAITHGPVITDRKSTFQAHVIVVTSPQQIKPVMDLLLGNKKIANATHNVYAYRIKRADVPQAFLQDCDDDGETQAGSRLLHLLQVIGVTNVLVVVSRWFGGVHLGPDRFRHINNAARQALDAAGLIAQKNKTAQ